MFNELRIARDMKGKDKSADKFQTGAPFDDILAVDLEGCDSNHLTERVSLGEFLRRNSEEYWNKYIGLHGDIDCGVYRRYSEDSCCEELTQNKEERHRNFDSDNSAGSKKLRGLILLSAMTKIARRKSKAFRRKSSVLIQFYSKLRKREESSGSVVQHASNGNAQQTNCAANHQHGCVQHGAVLPTELTVITATPQQPAEPPPFLWVYSASNHSLDAQVHNSQDLLVRPDSCDVIDGECKNGLRKNLRGKWNRLVKKKPHHEIYTIPAELRPQLKQIYVY